MANTITKTVSSPKPETPFGKEVPWLWNNPPIAGTPTRSRCQSVVSEDEASTGVELVAFYRVQEVISADNNIDARSAQFDKPFGPRGTAAEFLRREMSACNHEAYLAAETKLSELRKEAFELVQPVVKRLVKSLSDELNDAALAAESR